MNLKAILRLTALLPALFFAGCGSGSGGSDSSSTLPVQQPLQRQSVLISGKVQLPSQFNLDNLSLTIGSVDSLESPYSGFVVEASYVQDGIVRLVTGTIDSGTGTYVLRDIPFGVEVNIEVRKGKVRLLHVLAPLASTETELIRNVDTETTAEALLYQQIKALNPQTTITQQRQLPQFTDSKTELRRILEVELANTSVEVGSVDITRRQVVAQQVQNSAQSLVDSRTPNFLPYAVFDQIGTSSRGAVPIQFTLYDREGDLADILFLYSRDGSTFLTATQSPESFIVLNQLTTGNGTRYSLSWDTISDLGAGEVFNARVVLKVYPAGALRSAQNESLAQSATLTIDNRGIAFINSATPAVHTLGAATQLTLLGLQFQTVSRVFLKYFGEDQFIQPRSFPLEFQLRSPQEIAAILPAHGLFPVGYRPVLEDLSGIESASLQVISIREDTPPDVSSPNMAPTSGVVSSNQRFTFEGNFIAGAFADRVLLRHTSTQETVRLSSESITLINTATGRMLWAGYVPANIRAGSYDILVRNTCDFCGAARILPQQWLATEPQAELAGLRFLDTVSEREAFNSTANTLILHGRYLSSVQAVRFSSDLLALQTGFDSFQSLAITTVSTSEVRVLVPQGLPSGQYWVGVRNQGGVTLAPLNMVLREGPIPSTSLAVSFFLDPGLQQPLGGSPPSPLNVSVLYARLSGERLSSLQELRLENLSQASLIYTTLPQSVSFAEAVVPVPAFLPPGPYSMTLVNNGGATPVPCTSSTCLLIRELAPQVSSVINIRALPPLSNTELLANDTAELQISGVNLAGTTGVVLSAATVNELTGIGGVNLLAECAVGNLLPSSVGPLNLFASFTTVTASVLPTSLVTPGCYLVNVSNTAGSTRTTGPVLKVYESSPVLNRVEPVQMATNGILSTPLVLSGTNLLGTRRIHFYHFRDDPVSCALTETLSNALFTLDRTALTLAEPSRVVVNPLVLQAQNTLPGNYLIRLENRIHPGLTPKVSACDPGRNAFRLAEPQLEFHGFVSSLGPLALSTVVAVTTTEPILFAGRYLNGLFPVKLQRRFSVSNLQAVTQTILATSSFTLASFYLPPNMLVGDYDLILQNSSGFGEIRTASLTVIETQTPVVSVLAIDGTTNANTSDIKLRLQGQNLESLVLTPDQISTSLALRDVCLRDERSTLSPFESEVCHPVSLSQIRLRVLPDESRYVELTLPKGFPGGSYFLQVQNMAGLRTEADPQFKLLVREPRAVFESVSVVKFPQETDYGFGENDRRVRFEIRGQNLSSVDEIRLIRETTDPLESVVPIVLTTFQIARTVNSAETTLVSTLEAFQRPGFYSLALRNNSLEFSEIPVISGARFAQQLSIREGAPRLIRSGCLDELSVCDLVPPLSTNSQCFPSASSADEFMSRNVDSTLGLRFSGCNFYTMNQVRVFRDGSLIPEYSFTVPELGQSLTGTQIVTRGVSSVEFSLPQFLRYIGFYDIEVTNQASTRRFRKRLRSFESFDATVLSLSPTLLSNTQDLVVNMSGDHLTGTTYVALFSVDPSLNLVTEVLRTSFTQNATDPLHFLTFNVPKNLPPATYGVKVINSRGFNSTLKSNIVTVQEAALSMSEFSTGAMVNDATRVLTVTGEGFWGIRSFPLELIPSQTAVYAPLNAALGISHQPISISGVRVVSRTMMELDIPARQLPGYYQISTRNTVTTTFNSVLVLHIREALPKIFDINPSVQSYAVSSMARIQGESYLGVRSGNQNTFVQLVSAQGSFARTLSVFPVSYTSMDVEIPQNLAIGEYQIKIRNTEGEVSSGTTTRFTVIEELPSIALISKTTLAYDLNFALDVDATVDFTGLNLQGIQSIELTTTVNNVNHRHQFSVPCPDLIPYISLGSCRLNTSAGIFPAVYDIRVTNSVGTVVLTQKMDVTIPASSVTTFTNHGPLNSENLIELTGAHLKRFEVLKLVSTSQVNNVFDILANTPAGSSYTEFGANSGFLLFNRPTAQDETFSILYQTYGDQRAGVTTKSLDFFQQQGFVPEITGIQNSLGTPIPTTSEFLGAAGAIATTSIDSGLPVTILLTGNHFKDIQRIMLYKGSKSFTLACTTAFGAASLNASTQPTVLVHIPSELFRYPPTMPNLPLAGGSCAAVNTTGPGLDVLDLPLQPGVYNFVLLGREAGELLYSSRNSAPSSIYFSEDYPDGISVNFLSPSSFNNLDIDYEVLGNHLAGTNQVRIYRSLAPPFSRSFAVEKSQITSAQRFTGRIPRGSIRGMKDPNFPYLFEVRNSRGVLRQSTPVFRLEEGVAEVTAFNPSSNRNNAAVTVTVSGLNLLGAGQVIGGPPSNPFRNQVKLIYKEGLENTQITSESVTVTASVSNQSLTSFQFILPAQLRSGEWVLSVENDHPSTLANPSITTGVVFTVVDSLMQVSQMIPRTSVYDALPTSLTLIGQSLGGIRTAVLDLISTSTQNQLVLSLVSSPDVTAATWGSASFTLPQSPHFLIPGVYSVTVTNRSVTETLQNLNLHILEKPPLITALNSSTYNNSVTQTLNISGINLFGHPSVTLSLGSSAVTLPLTGVIQTPELLSGFVIPHSLYPDSWTLSLTNSVGSTSRLLVITESLPIISQILPSQVPFGQDAPISLKGDHLLGVLTSPASIVLTDYVRTPLLQVLPIDRYEVGAVVPQGVNIGRYEILLSNRSGRNSTSAYLTVTGSGLSLSSISPSTGLNRGGERVIVQGSGFTLGTALAIGGSLALDVVVAPNTLEATVPRANSSIDLSSGSTLVDLEVRNPDGQSVILPRAYTYLTEAEQNPRILSVVPGVRDPGAAKPIGIPLNSKIAVLFDRSMDPATVTSTLGTTPEAYRALHVLSNRATIGGTMAFDLERHWFVFDAQGNLFVPSQDVEVGFSSILRGSNGLALATTDVIQQSSAYFARDNFVEDWVFTSGTAADTGSLSVASTVISSSLSGTFDLIMNKPVNPLTIVDSDAVLIEVTSTRRIPVKVRPTRDLIRLVLDPDEFLVPNVAYELRYKAQNLRSLTDRSLSSDFVRLLNAESSGPNVLSIRPLNQVSEVPLNTTVIVTFDKAVDATTVTSSTMYVTDLTGTRFTGGFRFSDTRQVYTLKLTDFLAPATDYVATVSNRVKSLSGVAATREVTSRFRTSVSQDIDTSAPVVASLIPAYKATGVDLATPIQVTFSEPIHPEDVSTSTFQFLRETEVVPIQLQHSANLAQVNILPEQALEYGRTYRIRIAAGLHDLADNTSSVAIDSEFSTTRSFDTSGPILLSSNPANGLLGVATGVQPLLVFNDNLSAGSVIASNFRFISAAGNNVPFQAQFSAPASVRLSPSQPLARNTTYRIEVLSGLQDSSQNPAVPATITFMTVAITDTIAPRITLLTVNDFPTCLNGNRRCQGSDPTAYSTIVVQVPPKRFTIDIYYEDPGPEGEQSGVDLQSVAVTDEKQILNTQTGVMIPANANLLLQPGAIVERGTSVTRLTVPTSWEFQPGIHILRATVRDQSTQGNPSDPLAAEAQYQFEVVSESLFPNQFPFSSGRERCFALDYYQDRFRYVVGTRSSALTLSSTLEFNGLPDLQEEMQYFGLVSFNQDRTDQPTPAQIAANVFLQFQDLTTFWVRSYFSLGSAVYPIRFTTNIAEPDCSVIGVGGDNGAEWGSQSDREAGLFFNPNSGQFSGVIPKAEELADANHLNQNWPVALNSRSTQIGTGRGVFSAHILRRHANDPGSQANWFAVFRPFSPFAYANVGNQTGFPIGTFAEDANVYLLSAAQAQSLPSTFHRERHQQMLLALNTWARVVAASVARVAAFSVGALPAGLPPMGLFANSQDGVNFNLSQSDTNKNQLMILGVPENNLLRRELDLFSIINFSSFGILERAYLLNRVRIQP